MGAVLKRVLLIGAMFAAGAPAVAEDFGAAVDALLAGKSPELFGIAAPLAASAPESPMEGYRVAGRSPEDSLSLADGLVAEFLTTEAAQHSDMMAFYPANAPTHLIACIEADAEELAPGKMQPGVQRIALADGKVETIVRGTSHCDGIRATPWGTILFTEERDQGGAYEMLNPLAIAEAVTVLDADTGETSDPAAVVRRPALPRMRWEGIAVLPSGVVYGGDELRPGTTAPNADGGALFKFIPATPFAGGAIATLEESPFVAGQSFAMQVQCERDKVQYGQGCEVGMARWIEVDPAKARSDANDKGATGFYRPEDLHQDLSYTQGVRFCFTNTGNEASMNYAEVMCATDSDPMAPGPFAAGKLAPTTAVNRFIEGDTEFNSFDNLDFQPGTGILYVAEDHLNGDIWACLPDGADRDLKSDGCIRVASVKDSSAEPTGFIFDASGKTAYLSIQHSDDSAMPKVDGFGTDDLVKISGFGEVRP